MAKLNGEIPDGTREVLVLTTRVGEIELLKLSTGAVDLGTLDVRRVDAGNGDRAVDRARGLTDALSERALEGADATEEE
jgi:hypothetical protein